MTKESHSLYPPLGDGGGRAIFGTYISAGIAEKQDFRWDFHLVVGLGFSCWEFRPLCKLWKESLNCMQEDEHEVQQRKLNC